MKCSLLATVSLIALIAATPGRAASFTWTGCYVGAHVGGGWGQTGFADATPNDSLVTGGGAGWSPVVMHADTSGFLGGGQIGCNYQFAPIWVVGLEGDFSAAHISGSTTTPLWFNSPLDSKTDWLGSATVRIGYTWDRWLAYAKGGVGFAHNEFASSNYIGTWNASETRAGWTAGAGLEWAFMDNWSAKFEYDFYDLGSRDVTFTSPTAAPSTETMTQVIHTILLGVNYHFQPH
jgi:outer membrane immunogenic protein